VSNIKKSESTLKGLNREIETPVTDALLAFSPLPLLEGPEGVAERLVLLVHYGVDFTIWGGARRVRYWDALKERVRGATYSGPTLGAWWSDISTQIVSEPRNSDERIEILGLLSIEEQRETLNILRSNADVLVLRARVVSEYRKANKKE